MRVRASRRGVLICEHGRREGGHSRSTMKELAHECHGHASRRIRALPHRHTAHSQSVLIVELLDSSGADWVVRMAFRDTRRWK
jgi:hypothetical protein